MNTDRLSVLYKEPALSVRAASIFVFFFTAISFWMLDMQAVWCGDDFGYMFSDTRLHAYDGERVTNIGQIFSTQANHWMNCNGRFIVHSIVMFFVAIAGKTWFAVFNSLVFGVLVILFQSLVVPRPARNLGTGIASALILWIAIPKPGLTMLSLAAYSVNYLWTGTAILLFFLLWKKLDEASLSQRTFALIAAASLLIGALQESFSAPVSVGLLVWWIVNYKSITRRQKIVIILFWIGTLFVFFAPGNLYHASQGGGLAGNAIAAKSAAFAKDILFSPVNLLALVIIGFFIIDRNRCAAFCRDNLIIITSVIAAIALCLVSYTAVRQLTAPSLLSALLLCRLFISNDVVKFINSTIVTVGLIIIYSGMSAGAANIRQYPARVMQSIETQIKNGNSYICFPKNKNTESKFFLLLFDRFNDDPTTNRDIKLLFDGYSKQGFSRLYSPKGELNKVTTFLPLPVNELKAVATQSRIKGNLLYPATINDSYAVAKIPLNENGDPKYSFKRTDGVKLPFERYFSRDYLYLVVPADATPLAIKISE
ncbi:MAG: hypothetical protein J6C81_00195 [Muribaculaceae bacterium]|nr:hypothetical protein [Muribaculaceae bacterium]